jgi:hypothetical protein
MRGRERKGEGWRRERKGGMEWKGEAGRGERKKDKEDTYIWEDPK